MSQLESYVSWLVIEEKLDKLDVTKVIDDNSGLVVYVSGIGAEKQIKKKLFFDSYVGFRCFDESYRYRTFAQNTSLEHNFYKVENSMWVKWLKDESLNIYSNDINHYLILSQHDVVEILSEYPPEIISY